MSSKKDNFTSQDKKFMQLALKLASVRKGLTGENPSVGCLIVKNDQIISIGQTGFNGRPHAEHNAINNSVENVKGSKMYVTLEPCNHYGKTPPCTNSIIKSGISEIIYGMDDIDKKVNRTKLRPIASKKISIQTSIIYATLLCLIAFLILVQFNFFTIALGMGSMILAFSYPFMKRFTYWPQLFLGITFNWGILMAFAAVNNYLNVEILLIYFSAIFWTLGYDTIYGTQDMSDDEIIGLKSTSIKFKKNIKLFLFFSYLITSLLIIYLFIELLEINFSLFFLISFFISLFYQIFKFNEK